MQWFKKNIKRKRDLSGYFGRHRMTYETEFDLYFHNELIRNFKQRL